MRGWEGCTCRGGGGEGRGGEGARGGEGVLGGRLRVEDHETTQALRGRGGAGLLALGREQAAGARHIERGGQPALHGPMRATGPSGCQAIKRAGVSKPLSRPSPWCVCWAP